MNSTFVFSVWRASQDSVFRQAILAVVGTLLLAISAKVQIPFWPVPMTMQTFVVLLLGISYGPRLGTTTGILYLVEGAVGLPVFAQGAGFAYLMGPTGGYLFGFVLAMYATGMLAQRGWGQSVYTTFLAMLIGETIIFALGVGWLTIVVGLNKAISAGLTPFLLAEIFKVALAVVTLPLAWKRFAK